MGRREQAIRDGRRWREFAASIIRLEYAKVDRPGRCRGDAKISRGFAAIT